MNDAASMTQKASLPRWIHVLRASFIILYVLAIPFLVISFFADVWLPVLALLFVIGPLSLLTSVAYLIVCFVTRNKYSYKTSIFGTVLLTIISLTVNFMFLYIVITLLTQPIFD